MILAVVAAHQLDPQIAGYAVGALLLVCVAVCGAAVWLDTRTIRTMTRLADELRQHSNR